MPIEKILHQIWIQGGDRIPLDEKKLTEMWKIVCSRSGYRYKIWSEIEYRSLLREKNMEKEYDSLHNFTQKSDIARWVILNEFGGFYIDVDIEPIFQKFPRWKKDCVLARVPLGIFSPFTISVNFVGVSKNHPLPFLVLSEMKTRLINVPRSREEQGEWGRISFSTGSGLLKDVIKNNSLDVEYIDSPQNSFHFGDGYYLSTSPQKTEYYVVHQIMGKDECNSICWASRAWSKVPHLQTCLLCLLIVLIIYAFLRF